MAVHSLFFLLFISLSSLIGILGGGFEVELIHRDSPASPLFNHSATPGERARDASFRSLSRFNRMTAAGVTVDFLVHPGHDGEFVMEVRIGTPLKKIYAIMDTGSDLSWVQCPPCHNCFRQNSPLYDSSKSSTYRTVSCEGRLCSVLPLQGKNCGAPTDKCIYAYGYADGSRPVGVLASETFMFPLVNRQGGAFTNVLFGCGHENNLRFPNCGSGIVDLEGGALSLISQFGSNNLERKFSYYMPTSPEYSSSLEAV